MVASSQRSRFPPSRNYCSNVTNTQFRGTRKVQPSIPIHAINRSDSPGSILFSVFEINPWEYCWWKCYAILVQLFLLFLIFNCSSPYSTCLSHRIESSLSSSQFLFQFHLTIKYLFSRNGYIDRYIQRILFHRNEASSPLFSHLFVDIFNGEISARGGESVKEIPAVEEQIVDDRQSATGTPSGRRRRVGGVTMSVYPGLFCPTSPSRPSGFCSPMWPSLFGSDQITGHEPL